MSDESTAPTIECARCGINGFPPESCQWCQGKAEVQPRQYTLSEERSGRAPQKDRHGPSGVGPRIINLPGSGGQGGDPSTN